MKTRTCTRLAVVVSTAMMITGCGGSKEASASTAPANNAPTTAEAMNYEVGCGSCIFDMAGFEGCAAAVMVDGKAYQIEGVEIPAHKIGLCKAGSWANMAGEVKDDTFIATSFALTGSDDDADAEQEGDKQEGSHQEDADGGAQGHEGHDHGHEGHGH
ncbi:MAG: DUF6370 family protein [Lentisphaeria bacterium]|nr:DUF6370 family protein [Lentisphaeria bacterium]